MNDKIRALIAGIGSLVDLDGSTTRRRLEALTKQGGAAAQLPDIAPDWRGEASSGEPPPDIRVVRDADGGYLADRVEGPCEYGGGYCGGGVWRWRHNGNSACWLDIDGIGPWDGWR